jgi:hypothetical protein
MRRFQVPRIEFDLEEQRWIILASGNKGGVSQS